MPKSRKRHHSRSRSKSRSHSRDRSRDRDDKYQKNENYEKDRDGKRRKLDSSDSPNHRKSVSSEPDSQTVVISSDEEFINTELKENSIESGTTNSKTPKVESAKDKLMEIKEAKSSSDKELIEMSHTSEDGENKSFNTTDIDSNNDEKNSSSENNDVHDQKPEEDNDTEIMDLTDPDKTENCNVEEKTPSKRKQLEITPKKVISPKQTLKRLESEKKRQEKQREKEEKEKKRIEEKELKQKEKELKEAQKREEREKKEEQKRKEREEKEQKRKEKEEKEEQKRKEREMEKMKKQQEIEEKNKEKQKEEEKKQKAAAAFVNFFVAKKSDNLQEKKPQIESASLFKAFEVKSDMRLPPLRRKCLSEEETKTLDSQMQRQSESLCYLKELKSGKIIRTSSKTWPYQEMLDDDVLVVEDNINLGETICEDKSKLQKFRAKFLKFHENRRPAYYGTWRKKSKFITPRKPFAEDSDMFNYDEDSDDDWEEEEQGESLNGSDDEEKENEEERDEYEVDNEFFVPHGHLSDDEIDDEEIARLSPESMKLKLKILNDEFERDMQLKTHKLKSRSIGCIWYNKNGSNIDEAIDKYLQPFAVITNGQIEIKKRSEIFVLSTRKSKLCSELSPDHIPLFLKVIHGNPNKKTVLVDQFITYMANKGINIDLKKGTLIRILKQFATWKQSKQKGSAKNKFLWLVNEDIEKKFNIDLVLPNFLESDAKK